MLVKIIKTISSSCSIKTVENVFLNHVNKAGLFVLNASYVLWYFIKDNIS